PGTLCDDELCLRWASPKVFPDTSSSSGRAHASLARRSLLPKFYERYFLDPGGSCDVGSMDRQWRAAWDWIRPVDKCFTATRLSFCLAVIAWHSIEHRNPPQSKHPCKRHHQLSL